MSLRALTIAILAYPHTLSAQSANEIAVVISHFEPLQLLSFEYDREYCGYVGWSEEGDLVFSAPILGHRDGCTPENTSDDITVFASYHTHGAFDQDVPAEFPTILDVESDHEEGIDGFISTPGGRLWHVNSKTMTIRLLCGPGCISQDPNFQPGLDGKIADRYTYETLLEIEATR